MTQTKICKQCGIEFKKPYKYSRTQWEKAVFCSRQCKVLDSTGKRLSNTWKMTKECLQCKAVFSRNEKFSNKQWEKATFCSNQCSRGTREVIINGNTYAYTGGEDTTTLTGVSPTPV